MAGNKVKGYVCADYGSSFLIYHFSVEADRNIFGVRS